MVGGQRDPVEFISELKKKKKSSGNVRNPSSNDSENVKM